MVKILKIIILILIICCFMFIRGILINTCRMFPFISNQLMKMFSEVIMILNPSRLILVPPIKMNILTLPQITLRLLTRTRLLKPGRRIGLIMRLNRIRRLFLGPVIFGVGLRRLKNSILSGPTTLARWWRQKFTILFRGSVGLIVRGWRSRRPLKMKLTGSGRPGQIILVFMLKTVLIIILLMVRLRSQIQFKRVLRLCFIIIAGR